MSQRLIYVMGPSGAGKDSVLGWLRGALPASSPVAWARRTITRAADAGGEAHEPVTATDFEALHAAGEFAMAWQANGLRYGIRRDQLAPALQGRWVWVNGSRAYLDEALHRYPGMRVVHITAPAPVLEQRLLARGRETPEQVRARVARATAQVSPPGTIEIVNDNTIEQAGLHLLQALRRLEGWPAASGVSGLLL